MYIILLQICVGGKFHFSVGGGAVVVMIVWQLGLQQLSMLIATNYKCCEFESHSWQGVLDTTLCDKVCQWLSPITLVSSTNKTDHHVLC
jgi:hypothetical protein